MRISFDIDGTLVLYGRDAPLPERGRFPAFLQRWLTEPLRPGARALVSELRRLGCSIWIYTTSSRSPFRIRLWLYLHGIRIDGVVNDARHRQGVADRRFGRVPSKYPPAYGIDLHVDDSEGVRMEGEAHGFRVIVIHRGDERWTEKVLAAIA